MEKAHILHLIREVVPSLGGDLQDIVVGFEDLVGKPVVSHELPNVFHRA